MKKLQREQGFTLVELAIVLTIIGILLGGILKGQQLITNARVTSQIAQFQSIQAAHTTFQDTYAALAGDMTNTNTRLPNCTAAPCSVGGNGNGLIGAPQGTVGAGVTTGVTGAENIGYWAHLSAANLVSGVLNGAGTTNTFGSQLPTAKLGAGLVGAQLNVAAPSASGFYVINTQLNAASATAGQLPMTPGQAAQIDRKLDDGTPTTGNAVWYGAAACVNGTQYNEAVDNRNCGLAVRVN